MGEDSTPVWPPPVLICIGSDDPITIATDLRHEYQLVLAALISAGRPAVDASHWLDRVRGASLAARFTLGSLPAAEPRRPAQGPRTRL
jgi:hypothetical protein